MTSYTAIIRSLGSEKNLALTAKTDEGARRQTIKIAREHPDDQVFCEFFRASDGCRGYINRNGFATPTGRAY